MASMSASNRAMAVHLGALTILLAYDDQPDPANVEIVQLVRDRGERRRAGRRGAYRDGRQSGEWVAQPAR